MYSRRIFVALSLLLTTASLATAQGAIETTLTPSKVLDLRTILPPSALTEAAFKVHYFRAHNTGLFVAISPSFNTLKSRIVHVDYQGIFQKSITLPPDSELTDFDLDRSGRIYALTATPQKTTKTTLLVYKVDGALEQTRSVPDIAGFISVVDDVPVFGGQTGSGSFVFRRDGELAPLVSVNLQRSQTRVIITRLPNRRFVLAERTAAVLHFVDLERRSVAPFSPRVPEMNWLSSIGPGNKVRNVAFSAMTASDVGNVYVLISRYKLSDGAPVMYLHMNGNLAYTMRCKLPQFAEERTANNPNGEMIPSEMGIGRGTVLILVSVTGKIALYSL